MRDAFLVFLMLIAATLLYGASWLGHWSVTGSGHEESALLGLGGVLLLVAAAAGLLLVVGNAVGVTIPGLAR